MKQKILLFQILIFFTLSFVFSTQKAGSLVIIGGRLESENRQIYSRFISLGGGKKKIKIAIIPAASAFPSETALSFSKNFVKYGVLEKNIRIFPIALKNDPGTPDIDESSWSKNAFNPRLAKELLRYNAVFFPGGDQLRYLKTLKKKNGEDSPVLESVRTIYKRGGVIGGTSAGAAIMSDPMIYTGKSVVAIMLKPQFQKHNPEEVDGVGLTEGFGFIENCIVDQHFIKRGRIGRLLSALIHLETIPYGFGIDENTAMVYRDNKLKVIGNSSVIIIDLNRIKRSKPGITTKNIIMHLLSDGDIFNMETRQVKINPERKKIKKGKEYYKNSPLNTNIFGNDVIKDIITEGLIDNRKNESEGLAFQLDANNTGRGVMLKFRKNSSTTGYFKSQNGKESYSAVNVQLEIYPISIILKRLH